MSSAGKKVQLDSSLSNLLNNNFDTDSLTCLQTCLKIIDNILQKPGNEKVRTIRITNPTIQKKITSRKGGVDILYSCGFVLQEEEQKLMTKQGQGESFLILTEENEDTEWLVTARHTLSQVAMHQLNCKAEDLPKFLPPKKKVEIDSTGSSAGSFNVYQGKRFDAQSASVGQSLGPPKGWKSATEAQLESLEKKQAELTKNHQRTIRERQWIALRPGETAPSVATSAIAADPISSSNSREDSALLASHMQKQHKQRQEEANRGFTTKAMRDLERIKKQKVYSHTLLAITFPDGCVCKGQFLPAESVQTVIESIQTDLLIPEKRQESFDLYMTPPRTKLLAHQTLVELGLVPAAKVYVSWKSPGFSKGGTIASYLNPALLQGGSSNGPELPSAVPVVGGEDVAMQQDKSKATSGSAVANNAKRKKTKSERQADMLKRMMGK
eukprot:scaffold7542_cov113-Cylindrotheca_fusiformis.AAC.2